MATNTYVALDTQTLGSAVSSVTFSSIPSGYTDLVLVMNGSLTGTGAVYVQFNGDTASNYSSTYMQGQGGSASSGRDTALYLFGLLTNGAGPNTGIANIMNYSNSTTYKTVLSRANDTTTVNANVGLWRGTPAAITSFTLKTSANNFAAGSTFNLYGIANADIGALATGGIITYDTNYYYHTFAASGTFTPKQALTVDMVIVGGGGGGAGDIGGGGGAGGFQAITGIAASTAQTVTIGSGGAGGASSANGTQGGTSTCLGYSSTGGGYGAYYNQNGGSGGSGGGGGRRTGTGGTATSGQGYAGGNGTYYTSDGSGGGGGGAGAVGQSNAGSPSNGGIGSSSAITGGATTSVGQLVSGTYYLAGGGGGGSGASGTQAAGGYGGGGLGGYDGPTHPSSTGTINTGGGGGGGANSGGTGSAGGSGVVIIRYPKA